jgi:hypothetical protein
VVLVGAVVVLDHLQEAQAHPVKAMPVAAQPIMLEAAQVAVAELELLVDQLQAVD